MRRGGGLFRNRSTGAGENLFPTAGEANLFPPPPHTRAAWSARSLVHRRTRSLNGSSFFPGGAKRNDRSFQRSLCSGNFFFFAGGVPKKKNRINLSPPPVFHILFLFPNTLCLRWPHVKLPPLKKKKKNHLPIPPQPPPFFSTPPRFHPQKIPQIQKKQSEKA